MLFSRPFRHGSLTVIHVGPVTYRQTASAKARRKPANSKSTSRPRTPSNMKLLAPASPLENASNGPGSAKRLDTTSGYLSTSPLRRTPRASTYDGVRCHSAPRRRIRSRTGSTGP